MNCTATGVMKQAHGKYEILTSSAARYALHFKDKDGNRILNPTDFTLTFFIKNYTTGTVTCSRAGGSAPVGCKIEPDGTVVCNLPKDTFHEGQLHFEVITSTPESGFPPAGQFEEQRIFDTGCRYINGRGI